MNKLLKTRKQFIFKMLAVLVVCAFLATSLVPSIGHSGTSANNKPVYDLPSIPFVSSNDNSSNAGYVKCTLVLLNNTLVKGNFINPENGVSQFGISFDPSNGYVYITNYFHSSVSVINGATNKVIDTIAVGSGPAGISFDSSNGYLYVANVFSYNISVINGATNKVIDTITDNLAPAGISFDSSNGYLYVANAGSHNISVINGATNKVIDTIAVGSGPAGISFDSSNGYLYVANDSSNNISVINGATNKVIDTIAVGSHPCGVFFDSSNGYLYVTNPGSDNISVINGTTNKVIDTIAVGSAVGSLPEAVSFDSNNGYLYVANPGSDNISVINGTTNKVIDTIAVGSYPEAVSFDSNNGYLYVTNPGSDNVSVINGATNKVIDTITVGTEPTEISFDSNNGYLYVANPGSDNISVINGATNKVIDTIAVGSVPAGISFDSNNGYIYVTNAYCNNISVINGTTNKVIDTIAVGSHPCGVSFDSSNGYLYVANVFSYNISVINGATNKVIDTIAVGSGPAGISFDSSNGYLYVTNTNSNNVSVINGATNKVIDTIAVGSYPCGVSFDSSNGYLYVTNTNSNNVSVINGATNKVIDTIAVGTCPRGISFDSSNGYLYVTNPGSDNVSVINGATNKIIDTITLGLHPGGVSFDSSNGYLYITNVFSGTISIISTMAKLVAYQVTFTESGLPLGESWSVTLNGTTESSATNTLELSLPNGTYSYTIGTVSGYSVSPLSGTVNVDGANVNLQIDFKSTEITQNKYSVLFTATGLPSGISWSVLLNKSMKSSTSSSIEFNETNGTYRYVVYPPIHMSANPDSGTVNVSGASVIVSISINYENWQSSQAFNISNTSITLGSVGGFVFNENVNSYPIRVYSIHASKGVNENEFASNLSYYLGINVNSSYSPAYVIMLDIPLVKVINTEFGTSLGDNIGMNLSKMLSSNLFMDGALNSTNSGNLILAFTLSYSTNINQYANLAISSVSSLLALAGLIIVDQLSPIKKSPIKLILSALTKIEADILSSFDLTITDITSNLHDLGALSAHTFTDLATFFKGISELIKAGSILNKFVSLLYFIGDLIFNIGQSAATSLLDLLSDASVITSLIQVSFTSVDITIDTLAFFNFYNVDSNSFFDGVKNAVDIATGIVDPNGSTVIPSVVEANGTIALGYDPQTGSMIYHNSYGFMFNTSSNYVMYLNRSFAGSFSIVYYSVGDGTALVPYESSIMVENDSINAITYAGVLPTGTNVSAEISLNNVNNISLVNSVTRPFVKVTDGKGGFNIWINGVNKTSSGSAASIYIFNNGLKAQATLESNGTYYYFKPYSYSPTSQFDDLYVVQNGTLGGYSFIVVPPQFQVTFQESGLPKGSEWYLNISGQGDIGPINGTSYTTVLPDGNYSFSVYAGSKYTYNSSKSFSINGANTTENLIFKTTSEPNSGSQLTNLIYSFIFIAIIIAVVSVIVYRNRKKR